MNHSLSRFFAPRCSRSTRCRSRWRFPRPFRFLLKVAARAQSFTAQRSRWLRAMVVLGASTALSLVGARVVEAKVTEQAKLQVLELNRQLAFLLGERAGAAELKQGPAQTHAITINGVALLVQSRSLRATDDELDQVLVRFAQRCQTPLEELSGHPGKEPLFASPSLQKRGEKESYFYCLRPRRPLTPEGIESSVAAFGATRNLYDLGQIEGIYLRTSGDRHRMLLIQSQQHAQLDRAFPRKGDAPGSDHPELPRPKGRRSLSCTLGQHPVLNIYEVARDEDQKGPPSNVLETTRALVSYKEQLVAQGLHVITPTRQGHASDRTLIARTASNTYLVVAHPSQRGAILSITRLVQ